MVRKAKNVMLYVILTAAFTAVTYFTAEEVKKERATLQWPTVIGKITYSQVASEYSRDSDGRTTKMYYPNIKYDYTVEGVDYKGDKHQLKQTKSSPDTFARNAVAEFPVNKTVPIYYDPKDASLAILSPGVSFITKLFLGVFGCVALGLWANLFYRLHNYLKTREEKSVKTV
tara:strand:+ start:8346 stop:8861 length:516 start_codon:yes stop_codon:yes gene_type:complete